MIHVLADDLKYQEMRLLLENWNTTMGDVKIYRKAYSAKQYYVWFWTGGHSENEMHYYDPFICHIKRNIIIDFSSIMVFAFHTALDPWFSKILEGYEHLVQPGFKDLEIQFIDAGE